MIDKTATIEDGAVIGKDVKIGPYCTVGKDVKLGDRVELVSHVAITGKTEIGEDTIVYPFAAIGQKSQDLKFQDDSDMMGVIIGKRCRIREYVTIQSGTPAGRGVVSGMFGVKDVEKSNAMGTIIGDDCQIMVNAHVAHDCQLGNNIVLSNLVQLAGHVEIEDHAIISAMSAVHQFCHIGAYAFLGAMSGTAADIPPYVIYEGLPAQYRTINRVGLARHGFGPEDIQAIYAVYTAVFGTCEGSVSERLEKITKDVGENRYAKNAIDFILHRADRGITLGREKTTYNKS